MKNKTFSLVFFLSLAAFLFQLWNGEFLMIDARFSLFVHEMRENGVFVFPQLYGKFYPDYLFFPTWMMMLFSCLPGGVCLFNCSLPTAIVSALLVALTYRVGTKLFSEKCGIFSALLLFASYEYFCMSRILSIDMWSALAVFLAWTAEREWTGSRKKWLHWLFPLLGAFAFLARGPIGTVLVTASVVSLLLVEREYKTLLIRCVEGGLVLGIMTALLLFAAYRAGGKELLDVVLGMQISQRMQTVKPLWYYFTNAAGSYAPALPLAYLAILWFLCRKKAAFFRDPENRPVLLVSAWLLIIILGMSVPGTKHLRYVVPALPPAAMLASLFFTGWKQEVLFEKTSRFFAKAVFFLPAAGAVILALLPWFLNLPPIVKAIGQKVTLSLWIPVILFVLLEAAVLIFRKKSGGFRNGLFLLACAVLTLSIRIFVEEPLNQQTMSSREFARKVDAVRNTRKLYFAFFGYDADENKLTACLDRKKNCRPGYVELWNGKLGVQQEYVQTPERHFEPVSVLTPGTLLIARKDRWNRYIPAEFRKEWLILAEGRLGRRDALLLEKRR